MQSTGETEYYMLITSLCNVKLCKCYTAVNLPLPVCPLSKQSVMSWEQWVCRALATFRVSLSKVSPSVCFSLLSSDVYRAKAANSSQE